MSDRFYWARLLAFVTGLVNQELLLRNEYLAAENRILRAHLPSRLRLSDAERSTLAEIATAQPKNGVVELAGPEASSMAEFIQSFLSSRGDERKVIPDPDAAAKEWHKKYGTVPVNHMVVVKTSLSKSDPGAVREVFRMLHESKKAAGLPKPGAVDTLPFGFDAVKPALDLMSSYALEMKIIPRRYSVEELFDDTTRALQG